MVPHYQLKYKPTKVNVMVLYVWALGQLGISNNDVSRGNQGQAIWSKFHSRCDDDKTWKREERASFYYNCMKNNSDTAMEVKGTTQTMAYVNFLKKIILMVDRCCVTLNSYKI